MQWWKTVARRVTEKSSIVAENNDCNDCIKLQRWDNALPGRSVYDGVPAHRPVSGCERTYVKNCTMNTNSLLINLHLLKPCELQCQQYCMPNLKGILLNCLCSFFVLSTTFNINYLATSTMILSWHVWFTACTVRGKSTKIAQASGGRFYNLSANEKIIIPLQFHLIILIWMLKNFISAHQK